MLQFLGSLITPTVIKWGLIIFCVSGLYFYIDHLRSENKRLVQDNATLQVAIETQKRALEQMKKDHEAIVIAKDQLNGKIKILSGEKQELIEKLDRESKKKKSIEELARKKSGLVEKAVNNRTAQALRCFELLSEGKQCL